MDSREYKERLESLIGCLPEAEREEAVSFYMEAIADRMDEGATEAEAVALIASPEEAAKAVLSEKISEMRRSQEQTYEDAIVLDSLADAYGRLAGEEAGDGTSEEASGGKREGFLKRLKGRRLSPLEWVAVVVTSPLWITVLVAAAAVVIGLIVVALAILLCAWVLVGCVWAAGGAFVLASPIAVVFAVWGAQMGSAPYALVNIGYAAFLFGAGIWVLRGAYALTRMLWRWQKRNVSVTLQRFGKKKAKGSDAHADPAECDSSEGSLQDTAEAIPEGAARADGGSVAHEGGAQSDAQRRWGAFFKVCLIMLLCGLACALAGFILSGFDWSIFLTSVYSEGDVYLGGIRVEDPGRLLFSPYMLFAA